jgi:hypothetical protein
MFVLSRRLAQPRVGLLATALMACSAFQVWYAQQVPRCHARAGWLPEPLAAAHEDKRLAC